MVDENQIPGGSGEEISLDFSADTALSAAEQLDQLAKSLDAAVAAFSRATSEVAGGSTDTSGLDALLSAAERLADPALAARITNTYKSISQNSEFARSSMMTASIPGGQEAIIQKQVEATKKTTTILEGELLKLREAKQAIIDAGGENVKASTDAIDKIISEISSNVLKAVQTTNAKGEATQAAISTPAAFISTIIDSAELRAAIKTLVEDASSKTISEARKIAASAASASVRRTVTLGRDTEYKDFQVEAVREVVDPATGRVETTGARAKENKAFSRRPARLFADTYQVRAEAQAARDKAAREHDEEIRRQEEESRAAAREEAAAREADRKRQIEEQNAIAANYSKGKRVDPTSAVGGKEKVAEIDKAYKERLAARSKKIEEITARVEELDAAEKSILQSITEEEKELVQTSSYTKASDVATKQEYFVSESTDPFTDKSDQEKQKEAARESISAKLKQVRELREKRLALINKSASVASESVISGMDTSAISKTTEEVLSNIVQRIADKMVEEFVAAAANSGKSVTEAQVQAFRERITSPGRELINLPPLAPNKPGEPRVKSGPNRDETEGAALIAARAELLRAQEQYPVLRATVGPADPVVKPRRKSSRAAGGEEVQDDILAPRSTARGAASIDRDLKAVEAELQAKEDVAKEIDNRRRAFAAYIRSIEASGVDASTLWSEFEAKIKKEQEDKLKSAESQFDVKQNERSGRDTSAEVSRRSKAVSSEVGLGGMNQMDLLIKVQDLIASKGGKKGETEGKTVEEIRATIAAMDEEEKKILDKIRAEEKILKEQLKALKAESKDSSYGNAVLRALGVTNRPLGKRGEGDGRVPTSFRGMQPGALFGVTGDTGEGSLKSDAEPLSGARNVPSELLYGEQIKIAKRKSSTSEVLLPETQRRIASPTQMKPAAEQIKQNLDLVAGLMGEIAGSLIDKKNADPKTLMDLRENILILISWMKSINELNLDDANLTTDQKSKLQGIKESFAALSTGEAAGALGLAVTATAPSGVLSSTIPEANRQTAGAGVGQLLLGPLIPLFAKIEQALSAYTELPTRDRAGTGKMESVGDIKITPTLEANAGDIARLAFSAQMGDAAAAEQLAVLVAEHIAKGNILAPELAGLIKDEATRAKVVAPFEQTVKTDKVESPGTYAAAGSPPQRVTGERKVLDLTTAESITAFVDAILKNEDALKQLATPGKGLPALGVDPQMIKEAQLETIEIRQKSLMWAAAAEETIAEFQAAAEHIAKMLEQASVDAKALLSSTKAARKSEENAPGVVVRSQAEGGLADNAGESGKSFAPSSPASAYAERIMFHLQKMDNDPVSGEAAVLKHRRTEGGDPLQGTRITEIKPGDELTQPVRQLLSAVANLQVEFDGRPGQGMDPKLAEILSSIPGSMEFITKALDTNRDKRGAVSSQESDLVLEILSKLGRTFSVATVNNSNAGKQAPLISGKEAGRIPFQTLVGVQHEAGKPLAEDDIALTVVQEVVRGLKLIPAAVSGITIATPEYASSNYAGFTRVTGGLDVTGTRGYDPNTTARVQPYTTLTTARTQNAPLGPEGGVDVPVPLDYLAGITAHEYGHVASVRATGRAVAAGQLDDSLFTGPKGKAALAAMGPVGEYGGSLSEAMTAARGGTRETWKPFTKQGGHARVYGEGESQTGHADKPTEQIADIVAMALGHGADNDYVARDRPAQPTTGLAALQDEARAEVEKVLAQIISPQKIAQLTGRARDRSYMPSGDAVKPGRFSKLLETVAAEQAAPEAPAPPETPAPPALPYAEPTREEYDAQNAADLKARKERAAAARKARADAKKAAVAEPAGADLLSGLVTPREAEVKAAEELGVSTEELATLSIAQTENLIRQKQAQDMAARAKADEEKLKTAGSRAKAAGAAGKAAMPGLETPMEAMVKEAAAVGLSPDEAVRVGPEVIAKKQKQATEDKIAALNAADAERAAKVAREQQARVDAARAKEEAEQKIRDERTAAAAEAAAKAKEELAKAEIAAAEAAKPKVEAGVVAAPGVSTKPATAAATKPGESLSIPAPVGADVDWVKLLEEAIKGGFSRVISLGAENRVKVVDQMGPDGNYVGGRQLDQGMEPKGKGKNWNLDINDASKDGKLEEAWIEFVRQNGQWLIKALQAGEELYLGAWATGEGASRAIAMDITTRTPLEDQAGAQAVGRRRSQDSIYRAGVPAGQEYEPIKYPEGQAPTAMSTRMVLDAKGKWVEAVAEAAVDQVQDNAQDNVEEAKLSEARQSLIDAITAKRDRLAAEAAGGSGAVGGGGGGMPPAPPVPPAGGGEDPNQVDAIVNQAIAKLGTGTNMPMLNELMAKLVAQIEQIVQSRTEHAAASGVAIDPTALRNTLLSSNVGGLNDLFKFLTNLQNVASSVKSQSQLPTVDVGDKKMQTGAAAVAFASATWLPEGLTRTQLVKIAEEFDQLGTEVSLLIQMARDGKLKIQQEVQSAAATPPGGAKPPTGGGSGGGSDGAKPVGPWGDSGLSSAPGLAIIEQSAVRLRNLSNIYRELNPQVAHLKGYTDQLSTSLQSQQKETQMLTQTMGQYMNMNTGIVNTIKSAVGRAAGFLVLQQIGREIGGVFEHLQGGILNFNQVLENTQVGFNTLFANSMVDHASSTNALVAQLNAAGTQIGFMREQTLSYKDAISLTAGAADRMVAEIRNIANITPFRFQPLVEASLKMKAFGFETSRIPGMINAISNAVAALGGNDEKIDRIAYALGQMNSAGRVYQNDMMQLANAGIAGYRMLSEKLLMDLTAMKKYSMGQLKDLPEETIAEFKRMQKEIGSASFIKSFGTSDAMIATLQDPKRAEGLIRALAKRGFLLGSTAAQAITEGMDRQYQGSADRLSKTMTGALSTIQDLSQNFMATAFEPLYKSIRDTIVQIGQFMLTSNEITVFVDQVRDKMQTFINSLKGFGPSLQRAGEVFINIFVGGFGAIMDQGTAFGGAMSGIIEKLGAGFALVGDILTNKVGRGLATAAIFGTALAKAIQSNPMIATLTLLFTAISGIASILNDKSNMLGQTLRGWLGMFAGAIESLIGVIGEAMTTITKAIGDGAVTGFISGLSAALAVAAPLLTTLLVMFTGLLKVITPIAGPLGVIIGLFIAFKTAQMAFNLVTVTLAKPIAAITSAWSSASGAMDNYAAKLQHTALMHRELEGRKIAAQDYVMGSDGKPLMRPDASGKQVPVLNYDRNTERISSKGYPVDPNGLSSPAEQAAAAERNAAAAQKAVRAKNDASDRASSLFRPDFGSQGMVLQHQDHTMEGHVSPVFNNAGLEGLFREMGKGGQHEAMGRELSKQGLIRIPGINEKGEDEAGVNAFATAYGTNLDTLMKIQKEMAWALTKAFEDVQKMSAEYLAAIESGDTEAANAVLSRIKASKAGQTVLPMIARAKGAPGSEAENFSAANMSTADVAAIAGDFERQSALTANQRANVRDLPQESVKMLVRQSATAVANGQVDWTPDEQKQKDAAIAAAQARRGLVGGSVGVLKEMASRLQQTTDSISKKWTGFLSTLRSGDGPIGKTTSWLAKLFTTVRTGGGKSNLQEIVQNKQGGYNFKNQDGSIGGEVSQDEISARTTMKWLNPDGKIGKVMGKLNSFAGAATTIAALGGAANRASGNANPFASVVGGFLGAGVEQTLSQKAGTFQAMGHAIGSATIGMAVSALIPIPGVGAFIGELVGGTIGEMIGNIADTAIRGSEAAVQKKKQLVAGYQGLGLDQKAAEDAANYDLKVQTAMGELKGSFDGLPMLVNDYLGNLSMSVSGSMDPQKLNASKAFDTFMQQDQRMAKYDENRNNKVDVGELTTALNDFNTKAMEKAGVGSANQATLFKRLADGSFMNKEPISEKDRANSLAAGYVDVASKRSILDISDSEFAAKSQSQRVIDMINTASVDMGYFLKNFGNAAGDGAAPNAAAIQDFKGTQIEAFGTNSKYEQMLNGIGISADEANKDKAYMSYAQSGKSMADILMTIEEKNKQGSELSPVERKLLQHSKELASESIISFFDEMGVVSEQFRSGMSRAMIADLGSTEGKVMTEVNGQQVVSKDASGKDKYKEGYMATSDIFGFHKGKGIGGDFGFADIYETELKKMGRIDPIDAMIEAGVIKSEMDLQGKTVKEVQDLFKAAASVFEAFRKRAEELNPKVDLKASRLDLMNEFGRELGYKLFDQFASARAKLAKDEKSYKKMGGEEEQFRLQALKDAGFTSLPTVGRVTNRDQVGGRDAGTMAGAGGVDTFNFMTQDEIVKLEKMTTLEKQIADERYKKFKVTMTTSKLDSADAATQNEGKKAAGEFARFEQDRHEELKKINATLAAGGQLSRAQRTTLEEEKRLRDKIFETSDKEVDLGQSLAILEKEGISISNKDLLNNQVLLQMIAKKSELQKQANALGQTAVFWAQKEALAKELATRLAAKQANIMLDTMEIQTKTSALQAKMIAGTITDAEEQRLTDVMDAFKKEHPEYQIKYTTTGVQVVDKELLNIQAAYDKLQLEIDKNPFKFSDAELKTIKDLMAKASGALISGTDSTAANAALQRSTALLQNMANMAQKAYQRVRDAQQKTHDEYIKQLDDQKKAIDERYKKRSDENAEKNLIEQMQLAGLAMRSDSADPIEAAKSFSDAKAALAEFYIQKQKDDEIKAIQDEQDRYNKQFEENTKAQEAVYNAALTRLQTRFDAVGKSIADEKLSGGNLDDLLRLTMSGAVPQMSGSVESNSFIQDYIKQAKEFNGTGNQTLALGDKVGNLTYGQFSAKDENGATYTPEKSLTDGMRELTGAIGNFSVFKGDTVESGLLATFMNQKMAADLKLTDDKKVLTGAASIKSYLESIMPKAGDQSSLYTVYKKGTADYENGREKAALYDYVAALMDTTNTFSGAQKLAILAQRTLEQGLDDFQKATNVDINAANLLQTSIPDQMLETFIKGLGSPATQEKVDALKKLLKDTYSEVLTVQDLADYEKFANSTDSRIGNLTTTMNSLDDVLNHLNNIVGDTTKFTSLDKILFGDSYNPASPLTGFDAATEQIDTVTASITSMQQAFEGTMSSLEDFANALTGPLGSFHQLALDVADISKLAAGISTGNVSPVTNTLSYNVPVSITINGDAATDTAKIAAVVEEAVTRAVRNAGGSYITAPIGPSAS